MANKKISELAVRTPSLTDLMLVGDPSTGYSYKATLSALSSLLEANIALDDLNDVTITSPTAGQVLSYNGTAWVNDTNGITGTGTTNYVPKFTSSSAIGNSQIFESNTSPTVGFIGIATTTPQFPLQVNGSGAFLGTGSTTALRIGADVNNNFGLIRDGNDFYIQENLSNVQNIRFTIKSGGNTGIGITSPAYKLDVNGDLRVSTIANATTDTDRFIVSDGGVIKYRTGAEVLSDIGGAAASSISGTTNYIPKFTSSSAIGDSQIFDNGTSVGIATATPSAAYRLDIEGNVRVRSGQILAFSNFDNTNTYQLYNIGGSGAGGETLVFTNGTTERMRLDASGNLGLGTSSPTALLDVRGTGASTDFRLSRNIDPNIYLSINAPGNTPNRSTFGINGTNVMTLNASGNVGIGTTTPNQRLTVGVAQIANTVMPVLKLTTTGTYSGAGSSDAGASVEFGQYHDTYPNWVLGQISAIRSGASWDGALLFYTNNGTAETNKTERMRITSGGSVGIGTTSPATTLDVIGAISLESYAFSIGGLRLKSYANTSSRNWVLGNDYNNFGDFAILQSTTQTGSTYTAPFYISSGRNVGIGSTSPAQQLEIKGAAGGNTTIQITSNNSNDFSSRIFFADNVSQRGYIAYSNFSNFLSFGTNSAEVARFTSAGELLINTTSDAGDFKLQVSGNAYVSGSVGIGITSPVTKTHIQQGLVTLNTTNLDNGTAVGLSVTYPDVTISGGEGIALALGMNGRGRSYIANLSLTANKDASEMLFYTEGSGVIGERMRITSGGNVGIGTTTPTTFSGYNTLAINGSSGGILELLSGGVSTGLIYSDANLLTIRAAPIGSSIRFQTEGVNERMRLTASGELLINTTSDAGDYKLQVNGAYYGNGRVYLSGTGFNVTGAPSLYLENTTATTGRTYALNSYNSGGFQVFDVTNANATVFLINSSGNAEIPTGSIKTAAPSGGTAKPWKLGGVQSTTIVLDDGAYVDVEIDGVAYKLALAVIP